MYCTKTGSISITKGYSGKFNVEINFQLMHSYNFRTVKPAEVAHKIFQHISVPVHTSKLIPHIDVINLSLLRPLLSAASGSEWSSTGVAPAVHESNPYELVKSACAAAYAGTG